MSLSYLHVLEFTRTGVLSIHSLFLCGHLQNIHSKRRHEQHNVVTVHPVVTIRLWNVSIPHSYTHSVVYHLIDITQRYTDGHLHGSTTSTSTLHTISTVYESSHGSTESLLTIYQPYV